MGQEKSDPKQPLTLGHQWLPAASQDIHRNKFWPIPGRKWQSNSQMALSLRQTKRSTGHPSSEPHPSVLSMVILLFSAFLTFHLPGSRGCCCLMCFISDVALMYFRANRSTEEARGKLRLGKPRRTWLYLITAQAIYFGFQKNPRLSSETFALYFKPGIFSSKESIFPFFIEEKCYPI